MKHPTCETCDYSKETGETECKVKHYVEYCSNHTAAQPEIHSLTPEEERLIELGRAVELAKCVTCPQFEPSTKMRDGYCDRLNTWRMNDDYCNAHPRLRR